MRSWSVAKRFYAAVGVLFVLMAVIVGKSMYAANSLTGVFSDYRSTSKQSLIVGDKVEDLFEARMASIKYRSNQSPAISAEVTENINEILEVRDAMERYFAGDPARVEKIGVLFGMAQQYLQAHQDTEALQAQRDQYVDAIAKYGKSARENLTEVMDRAYLVGDSYSGYHAGLAQQALLLTRYYGKTFLLTNDTVAYETAQRHLGHALREIALVEQRLDDNGKFEQLQMARQEFAVFTEALNGVHAVVVERNRLRTEVLDVIGPRMQADYEALFEGVVERQNALAASGTETIDATILQLSLLAFGALVVGLVVSTLIAQRTSRDVRGMGEAMSQLADGDLDVEITGADLDHELGRMAKALIVFRDNAQRVAGLQQEKEQADAAAAEERATAMRELGEAFGAVVDAAVAGDFSRKVDQRFGDAALDHLAESMNHLIERTGSGLDDVRRVMAGVAAGDLSLRMEGAHQGAFAELQDSVNDTVRRLDDLVARLSANAASLKTGAASLEAGATSVAARAEQQASSLQQTNATMEEISLGVKNNAAGSNDASRLAEQASQCAGNGGEIVESAVVSMTKIEESAGKIADIITVIDGIAFQTNLLALNAAVEAARAGDAGKGFAVVASEVRSLAQRSGEAARDIRGLIETSSSQVTEGVAQVQQAGESLAEIVDAITQVEKAVGGIARASAEQAAGIGEISSALNHMDHMTQQNSTMAEQSASEVAALRQAADELTDLISVFNSAGGAPAGFGEERAA